MVPARSARLLALVAALAFVLPVSGRTIAVSFDVKGAKPPVEATLRLTRGNGEPKRVVVTRFDVPQQVTIEPAVWTLEVQAFGFWHAPQLVTVERDEGAVIPAVAVLRATGSITAKITAERLPQALSARFEGRATDDQPLNGEVTCPVADGELRCALPAGLLDLRLHAPGHVTRFVMQQRVQAGKSAAMRDINLVAGQMIVGRVQLPRGMRDTAGVAVLVRASGFAPPNGAPILQQRAKVEKNGLFHLDGISPGAYTVTATAPGGLISNIVEVPVRAATETELRDPLVLYPALQLALMITPPLAPDQTPWRVRVSETSADSHSDLVASNATKDGRWSTARMRAGSYSVKVEQANGDVWHQEEIVISDSDEVRRVELVAQPLSGSVKLGDVPLQAKLTFSRGQERVHTVSERDGTFTLRLPARETKGWTVMIESSAPDVNRELDAELREAGDGRHVIDIVLPATLLSGKVVDEKGAAAPWALLTIRAREGAARMFQASSAPDGTFELHALEEGSYEIQAALPDAQSDRVIAKCCEDRESINIVMRRQRKVSGRVVSAFGPVAGAQLVITPVSTSRPNAITPVTTDVDGSFSSTIPASTNELDLYVAAHGLAFTMDHMRYRASKFVVTVEHRGGALTLHGKGSPQNAALVQDGAIIDPSLLAFQGRGQWSTTAEGWSAAMPLMEPGPYSLCYVTAENRNAFRLSNGATGGRCVSGNLPPGGALTLDVSN